MPKRTTCRASTFMGKSSSGFASGVVVIAWMTSWSSTDIWGPWRLFFLTASSPSLQGVGKHKLTEPRTRGKRPERRRRHPRQLWGLSFSGDVASSSAPWWRCGLRLLLRLECRCSSSESSPPEDEPEELEPARLADRGSSLRKLPGRKASKGTGCGFSDFGGFFAFAGSGGFRWAASRAPTTTGSAFFLSFVHAQDTTSSSESESNW
mmetsp:Transcript_85070/g.245671  ORF Transcript_85070/g.245671 Transcript_85070/m.245671 type:complete len:207 (-) Transcript_85070:23-643(-)